MTDLNSQTTAGTTTERKHVPLQWDEGNPFSVQIRRENKANTQWRTGETNLDDLFKFKLNVHRRPANYAEFLKHAW